MVTQPHSQGFSLPNLQEKSPGNEIRRALGEKRVGTKGKGLQTGRGVGGT